VRFPHGRFRAFRSAIAKAGPLYSADNENRTGTITSLATGTPEARAGSKVQVRTVSMADWSSSEWPLVLASETRIGLPSALTATVNRTSPSSRLRLDAMG
jgi:hypothetical protein